MEALKHIHETYECGKMCWRATIFILCAEGVWYQLIEAPQDIHLIFDLSKMCWCNAIVILCTEGVQH
jgi:hypothetical protein